MMKFKMKSLALAVGTVLGGISLIPSVQAVQLATDGLGEALIVPYYTTRAGWNTLINITNTSAEAVAVKVRFHEGYNSRDVFDFNVVLSPYDVWNGWVENGTGNVPRFKTNDNSCTIPQIVPGGAGQLFQGGGANGILAYTSPTGGVQAADGGPTDTERMREGYIVLMEMGSASGGAAYTASLHNSAGIPADCASLRTLFSVPTGITALRAAFPNYVANPLKGSFSLVNSSLGQNAAGTATTLADFFKLNPTDANDSHSLVTLQLSPTGVGGTGSLLTSFLEPDLHSTNTPGFVLWDGGGTTGNAIATPGTAEVATTAQPGPDQVLGGIDAVSFVLGRTNVVNQWARNTEATNGWATASDWVVTFPTKRFYTDQATHQFAARATGRPFTTPLPATVPPTPQTARWSGITAGGNPGTPADPNATPPAPAIANAWGITSAANPFNQLFTASTGTGGNGESCDPVTYNIWNREENIIVGEGGPVFSPAPSTPGNAICGEVNVLDFDGSRILGSADALYANISDLPGPNGWMDLNLQNTTSNGGFGLPVIGFSIITRATSSGSLNEAFIVDHAYKRNIPAAAVGNITVTVPGP